MSSSSEGITLGLDIPEGDTRASSSAKKRAGDAPPKPRKTAAKKKAPKPTVSAADVTTQEIEAALSMLLSMPAMPCEMVGDEWAANHFMQQGPNLAKQVAKQSERSPVLRNWCEKLVGGEAIAGLVLATFMYAMPPMMHWGLLPVPDEAKQMFGVPTTTPEAAQAASTKTSNPSSNGTGEPITGAI